MNHKVLVTVLATVFISGCAITKTVQSTIKDTNSNIDVAKAQYESSMSIKNNNFVKHSDTVYFGSTITPIQNVNLPAVFNEQIKIDKTFISMNDIADGLSRLTGIKVLVQKDDKSDLDRMIRVNQSSGTVSDLLDLVAAKADINWRYENGQILLQQTETKTWTIKNLPGSLQLQNQMTNNTGLSSSGGSTGSASSGGAGGSSSSGQAGTSSSATGNTQTNQNVQFTYNGDYWTSLDKAVGKMVSPKGSYSINDQTASVTVNDKPSIIAKINDYIVNQNDLLSRQVVIDVQVLSVETDATDNYGINWNLALKGSDASFSINGQASQTGSSGGTFVPSPVFLPSSTTQAFTVAANSGDLTGSQLIINALSSISRVSNVISTAAVTLSNQPVPINFTDQISYLASVQTTQTAQVGSQTALTPGQMTVGFSMNVLPVIEDDGVVRLQTSVSISNLKQMAQYSSGGSSIQLPTVGNRSFMQKTSIRTGDTFVVTGFDSDLNSITQDGVGGSSFWWLGGGVSANKKRTRLVILLTPRVVQS